MTNSGAGRLWSPFRGCVMHTIGQVVRRAALVSTSRSLFRKRREFRGVALLALHVCMREDVEYDADQQGANLVPINRFDVNGQGPRTKVHDSVTESVNRSSGSGLEVLTTRRTKAVTKCL